MKIGKLEEYRGYTGTIEYSGDDNVYFGQISNTKDVITSFLITLIQRPPLQN